jgi:hypothetical protein
MARHRQLIDTPGPSISISQRSLRVLDGAVAYCAVGVDAWRQSGGSGQWRPRIARQQDDASSELKPGRRADRFGANPVAPSIGSGPLLRRKPTVT